MSASAQRRLLAPLLALLLAVGLGAWLTAGGDAESPDADARAFAQLAASSLVPSVVPSAAPAEATSSVALGPTTRTSALDSTPTSAFDSTPTSVRPEPVELAASDAAEAPLPSPVPGWLLVVVKDPDGNPIEGAWVAAAVAREPTEGEIGDLGSRPAWKAGQHAATDGSGRAVVPLPPGATKVTAYAKFGAREGQSDTVEASRWVVEVVVRPLDPPPPGLGALFLRFHAEGQRLCLAPVEVALERRAITLSGLYGGAERGRAVLQGTTDADGVLAIGRLPTGAYAITAFSPGRADVKTSVVVEAALALLDVELDEPGRDVSGPLVPPPGVGVGAVRVRVLTALGDYPATIEPSEDPAPGGEQGYRWRALRLPRGRHLVAGEVAGHARRCEEVVVDGPTALETGPTLSWAFSGTVRGRVMKRLDEPRPNEPVILARIEPTSAVARPRPPFVNRVDAPGRPRATAELRDTKDLVGVGLGLDTVTDGDGRFVLRGLAPDLYVLHVGKLEQPLGVSGELDLGELFVPDELEEGEVSMTVVGNVVAKTRLSSARVTGPKAKREVGPSGAFALEVRGKHGALVALEAEGVDVDGHHLFSGEPLVLPITPGTVVADLELLAAARLAGRLLLPPGLGGRESAVIVRAGSGPLAEGERPPEPFVRQPTVDADGRWSVAEVPARRPLFVEIPGVSTTRLVIEPGEEAFVGEDLTDRTQLLPVTVRNLPDPRAHATVLVVCETPPPTWPDERVTPVLARAPLHGGAGVVPGLRPGRATVEVEVEEPASGTFWRVRRDLDLRPGAALELDLPHARGQLVGQIPRPWPRLVRARSIYGQVDVAEVMTDGEGRFTLDLPAGGWTLEDERWRTVDVEVPVGLATTVELVPR